MGNSRKTRQNSNHKLKLGTNISIWRQGATSGGGPLNGDYLKKAKNYCDSRNQKSYQHWIDLSKYRK